MQVGASDCDDKTKLSFRSRQNSERKLDSDLYLLVAFYMRGPASCSANTKIDSVSSHLASELPTS